jgi:tetratricopeptide (TPR) repeat protein
MHAAYFVLFLFCTHPVSENHVARGDEYYRALDNEHALREYKQAYSQSPTDYTALLRMVRIYNDNGRIHLRKDTVSESEYRTALMYADSLAYYYPDSAAAQFWMALAKGSLIPFAGIREKISIGKEVRRHVQKSLERDSTFSYAYVIRAIFERVGAQLSWLEKGFVRIIFGEDLSGSLEASERFLQDALRYDPENVFAYYELSRTYQALGDTAQAAASLRRVVALEPRNLREKCQQDEARHHLSHSSQKNK